MTARTLMHIVLGAGRIVFLLAVAWPTLALLARCFGDAELPAEGFLLSSRQWSLLLKSVGFSAAGTVAGLLLAMPAAAVIARAGQVGRRPELAAALLGLLLCPPMAYSFGWDHLLPGRLQPELRCVLVWSLWGWPIAAVLIGTGWARMGRSVYEAALLCTSAGSAFFRIVLPSLRGPILAAALVLFVLFLGDYGVPHSCGLRLYATELLGWATASPQVVDVLWPSLPMLAVLLVSVLIIPRLIENQEVPETAGSARAGRLTVLNVLTWIAIAVSTGLPIAGLIQRIRWNDFVLAWQTYGVDLSWTLGTGLLAAAFCVAMGLAAAYSRWRMIALYWTLLLGALPGALVGTSLVSAYNHATTAWIYDHWPIVVLCYVSRFGWVAVATCVLLLPRRSELADQAAVDGADRISIFRFVHVPALMRPILCSLGIVTALAVAEVPASTLVRAPDFNPIAHVIIEKFHRFEDAMLVTLSLWLIVAAAPAILLLYARTRSRFSS